MNLYFCFSYSTYYPCGGMSDCSLMTGDFDEAKKWLLEQKTSYGNAYIYDVDADNEIHQEDLDENN